MAAEPRLEVELEPAASVRLAVEAQRDDAGIGSLHMTVGNRGENEVRLETSP